MQIEYLIENIEHYRNDLFAEMNCIGCADKNKKSNKLKFTGYNDNYFFNVVNKDFRNYTCEHCGTNWLYKWTVDGVVVKRP